MNNKTGVEFLSAPVLINIGERYFMSSKKYFITTIGGRKFNPLSPSLNNIDIEDIAHSLSLICRANGHFKQFFSVARHCINCAKEAKVRGHSPKIQMLCLLHDATEAYVGDMTRPLKLQLDYYCECEDRLYSTILKALDITPPTEEEKAVIKAIDDCMLYHEFRTFNGDCLFDEAPPIHIKIEDSERTFAETKTDYLVLYHELCKEVEKSC